MVEKHYNPILAVRLRTLVDGRQWLDIPAYLSTLSHSQFRTAGYILGEKIMPQLDADAFWTLAKTLVDYNAKAFLVTLLKGWMQSSIPLRCPSSHAFFSSLQGSEEDQRKTMQVLLPVLTDISLIEWLESTIHFTDARKRVACYLNTITIHSGYLLLQALHQLDDDRALLVRTTHFLMKRGDGLSFNLASLFCTFFGLDEVKGTFSLRIQPFQLARLASDFGAFSTTLNAI